MRARIVAELGGGLLDERRRVDRLHIEVDRSLIHATEVEELLDESL